MAKIKLLWVVFDFVQAGGQRYVYEICKALGKQKYEIDFLRVADFGSNSDWDKEYYHKLTLDLGCKIYSIADFTKAKQTKPTLQNRIKSKIEGVFSKKKDYYSYNAESINSFFSKYTYVHFSGVAVYSTVCCQYNLHPSNAIIHMLTAKYQGHDIYKQYDKEKPYFFVSGFEPHILKSELSEFKNYKHVYFPLSLQSDTFSIESTEKPYLKIGVFTRLSPMKPLDPYFYALKLLSEKGLNVKLHIYGAGDPYSLGLIRQLNYLYITDKVVFCGHTESIKEALINEDFDLVWFQASNGQLAGYAALEIAMGGVPQVLWDFSYIGEENKEYNKFPCFTNLTDFVALNNKLLLDKTTAKKLGKDQQKFVTDTHLIEKNIKALESIYNHVD